MRVGLVLAVAELLIQAPSGTARAYSPAYQCGTLQANHCYGQTSWVGSTYGVWTDIWVSYLKATSYGFIDDETWLTVDNVSFWVETGYESVYNVFFPSLPTYFWADQRPGSGFYAHYFGFVPNQDFGGYVHFVILANDPSTQSFNVYVWNDQGTTGYYGESTYNTMSAHKIIIGQELAGTGGAFAPQSFFSFNAWATSPLANNTFYGNFQNTDGFPVSQDPPYAKWLVEPRFSPTGGEFITSCC
jgi:hypothetical protein